MTVPILNGRMYIVASPALASQIQRSSATLDFEQMTVEALPRLVGVSKDTYEKLNDEKRKEENRERKHTTVMHLMHPLLAKQNINGIAIIQLKHFTDFINAMPNGLETELFKFLRSEVTAASMYTFYGPGNPFAVHPELIEEFWKWEGDLVAYMMQIFPQWTARDAYYGIKNLTQGFKEYIENGRQAQAYELLQRRQQAHAELGISAAEQGRLEAIMALALNVNAGIVVFWFVNCIYSRPSLLAEIRDEIQTNALVASDTISFTALKDSCRLLNSVYRESMRLCAPMISSRYVLEDTLVADKYLLKKNSVVQIAGGVLHADREIWGPDADQFNPHRFLYNQSGSKTSVDGSVSGSRASQVHPAAYRAFGGGSSLCPGRHFAQIEILALAAVMVMGFDLEPPKGQEKVLWDPPIEEKRFPIAVMKPMKELNVQITRRKGMENIEWNIKA